MLPLISVLAENTLLKTAYHFLLLLVGFDTLIYRKNYDRSPILVGHQCVRVQNMRSGRAQHTHDMCSMQSQRVLEGLDEAGD